jgi:hypothetical protein
VLPSCSAKTGTHGFRSFRQYGNWALSGADAPKGNRRNQRAHGNATRCVPTGVWDSIREILDCSLSLTIRGNVPYMRREVVLIQVKGAESFSAEVDLDVDALDPGNMPRELTGVIAKLSDGEAAEQAR